MTEKNEYTFIDTDNFRKDEDYIVDFVFTCNSCGEEVRVCISDYNEGIALLDCIEQGVIPDKYIDHEH